MGGSLVCQPKDASFHRSTGFGAAMSQTSGNRCL